MKTFETIGGILLVSGMAYCGWRLLLLGAKLRQKVYGEPKAPISLFNTSVEQSERDELE